MNYAEFDSDQNFVSSIVGKFIAPNREWIHMSRMLLDFEFIVMTKGTLYIAENNKKYELHEGEWMLCCPPCHQYGYKTSLCEFYWFHFSYNDSQNDPIIYNDNTKPHLPFDIGSKKFVLPKYGKVPSLDRILILMKQLLDCDRRYRNINLNSCYINLILNELYSQLYLTETDISKDQGNDQLYTDILDYVSWRIHDNLKVNEIADHLGFNAKYITTFFKHRSGLSIKQYIMREKMNLAKARLSESDTPVGVIAMELGFSDSQGFSNAFRNCTGQTPSSYRNTYGLNKNYHV